MNVMDASNASKLMNVDAMIMDAQPAMLLMDANAMSGMNHSRMLERILSHEPSQLGDHCALIGSDLPIACIHNAS